MLFFHDLPRAIRTKMNNDTSEIKKKAYRDVIESAKIVTVPWNRPCIHSVDIDIIRSDFKRITSQAAWARLGRGDVRRLVELCRCCLRFLPDWPRLIADAMDACFSFPDSGVRGLLWRSVVFMLGAEGLLKHGLSAPVK